MLEYESAAYMYIYITPTKSGDCWCANTVGSAIPAARYHEVHIIRQICSLMPFLEKGSR